jgi:hypothetical protein
MKSYLNLLNIEQYFDAHVKYLATWEILVLKFKRKIFTKKNEENNRFDALHLKFKEFTLFCILSFITGYIYMYGFQLQVVI